MRSAPHLSVVCRDEAAARNSVPDDEKSPDIPRGHDTLPWESSQFTWDARIVHGPLCQSTVTNCHIHHYPGASLCCNMVIWGVNAVNTSEYHSRPQISWTPLPLNIIRSPRSELLSQRNDQEDRNMSPCHEGAAQSEFGHQYVCRYFTVSLKSKYPHVCDRSFLTSLFYPRSTGRDKISLVGSMKQMRCYFNPELHSNQGIIQDDDDIMSWWCLSWHDINDKLITTYHLIEHHGHTLTPLCSHLRFIFRVTLQYDFPLSQNKYLDNIVTKPSWIGLKM